MMVMEHEVSVFDSLFSLIKDTDNEEYKPVTLLDIKKNLKDYSQSKLRSLASVLIDSLDDLAKDQESLKKTLKKYKEEVIKLSV